MNVGEGEVSLVVLHRSSHNGKGSDLLPTQAGLVESPC